MAFTPTRRAELEAQKLNIQPQLVLEIEGVSTLFGAVRILRLIRIGDPGLLIGNDWKIGGLSEVEDQEDTISFEGGTSTKIDQQLYPDKGSVSSISSVQVALIDKRLSATRLISPGVVLDDILGVKATLWLGFRNTAFKDDYIPIFTGIIDDLESGAGIVKLNLAHPEQLKRQDIFTPVDVVLASSINNSVVTIPLDDASGVPTPQAGPDGSFDTAIRFYVKIEDEIIRYTGVSGNNLTGCTRGSLGTAAAAHTIGAEDINGQTLLQIEDNAIDLGLKVMLSGKNGFYREDVAITRFLHPSPLETVDDSIFFENINLNRDYGVTEGDFITITGAANGANNVSAKQIAAIVVTENGSYAVISGVSFVEEPDTTAVVAFRSQFDTLGYGLAMTPDQIDVDEHIYWRNFQLASYQYRFVIEGTINGKDFLDKEIYKPIGAYSLPRQGRCSMGYHIGPIIRGTLPVLDRTNVKNPDKIKLRRTINRNFYNTIIYKFEKLVGESKFVAGSVTTSSESRSRIQVGTKALVVVSEGLRRASGGLTIAERVADRYLSRYKFATEFFESVSLLFRSGFTIEPGDLVLLDPAQMQISNTEEGNRNKPAKVFEVVNKSIDTKTGEVNVSLTDINFDLSERYGAVSPSSEIESGTTTSLVIRDSFGALFPGNESKKWQDYVGLPIIVHSPDWSFEEEVTLQGIDPTNRYRLILDPSTPLSAPPVDGYIIDIASYPTGAEASENDRYKAVHAFLSKTIVILSGDTDSFTVDTGEGAYITQGDKIRIHNADFSEDSGEVEVASAVGDLVTLTEPVDFTIGTDHVVENVDFPDGGKTYRIA